MFFRTKSITRVAAFVVVSDLVQEVVNDRMPVVLDLSLEEASSKDLKKIADQKKLQQAVTSLQTFDPKDITDECVPSVLQFTALTSLDVSQTNLTTAGVTQIVEKSRSLQSLTATVTPSDALMTVLARNLVVLNVQACFDNKNSSEEQQKDSKAALSCLMSSEKLIDLKYSGSIDSCFTLSEMKPNQNLMRLSLIDVDLGAAAIPAILECRALESLSVKFEDKALYVLDNLALHASLTELTVIDSPDSCEVASLENFVERSRVHTLELVGCDIDDAKAIALAESKNINRLDVSQGSMTSVGLTALCKDPALTEIVATNHSVRDAKWVAELNKNKSITTLNLNGNKMLTRATFETLARELGNNESLTELHIQSQPLSWGIRRNFAEMLERNFSLCRLMYDVDDVGELGTTDVIFQSKINSRLKRNEKIQDRITHNWARFAVVCASMRANRDSEIKNSILPLVDSVMGLLRPSVAL